jgi:hypothetical protein
MPLTGPEGGRAFSEREMRVIVEAAVELAQGSQYQRAVVKEAVEEAVQVALQGKIQELADLTDKFERFRTLVDKSNAAVTHLHVIVTKITAQQATRVGVEPDAPPVSEHVRGMAAAELRRRKAQAELEATSFRGGAAGGPADDPHRDHHGMGKRKRSARDHSGRARGGTGRFQ